MSENSEYLLNASSQRQTTVRSSYSGALYLKLIHKEATEIQASRLSSLLNNTQ